MSKLSVIGLGKLVLMLIQIIIIPVLNYNSFSSSPIIGLGWSLVRDVMNMFVIVGAILINACLGFYREYQAENTLEKLVTYIKDRSRVIRNGNEQEIESSLLVPGDVIKLAYGSRVPADARILSSNNLHVDEAILTGESAPEEKISDIIGESSVMTDRTNMVYAGTLVIILTSVLQGLGITIPFISTIAFLAWLGAAVLLDKPAPTAVEEIKQ